MNNRTLGTLGIACAPFLLLASAVSSPSSQWQNPILGATWEIFYLIGWMCSMVGLYRIEATGRGRLGKGLLLLHLFTLTLATFFSLYSALDPKANTPLFWVLDAFWPISNGLMLVVGLAVVVQAKLRGWQRYVPLAVGLWLPFALGALAVLSWAPEAQLLGGLYSAIAWSLLGFVVRSSAEESVYPVRGVLVSRG